MARFNFGPTGANSFQPSYHDQKRDYEAAQDSRDLQQDLQQILFPVQAAQGVFQLVSLQQRANSEALALEQATKAAVETDEADQAYADQIAKLEASGGKDRSLPQGTSAAGAKARMAAILGYEKTHAEDQLFQRDQILETQRIKEDAEAIHSLGDITSEEWNQLPEPQKAQARFDLQFNKIRGLGYTDADIQNLDIGGGVKVATLLADPNSFTPRGTLKPKVFGDITSALKVASDSRKLEQAGKLAAATTLAREEMTPQDKERAEAKAKADALDADKKDYDQYIESLSPLEKTRSSDEKLRGFREWQVKRNGGTALVPSQKSSPADSSTSKVHTVTSKEDYDKLPAGARFSWNGREATKK
jgi:hypothetical protein